MRNMSRSKKASVVLAIQLIFIALILMGPLLEYGFYDILPSSLTTLQWLGLGVMFLGLAFFATAVAVMGRNFEVRAMQRQTSQLVRSWPFSIVRNPVYLFGTVMSFGWCLFFASWIAFVSMVCMVLTLVSKIKIEEYYLLEKFGDEYRKYMQEVPRLFPSRIW